MAKRRSAPRAAREAAKRHPKLVLAVILILVIVIAVCACLYFFVFKDEVDEFLYGLQSPGDQIETPGGDTVTPGGEPPEVVSGEFAEIASADLSIHFIAPGVKASGDSALIKVGDTEVLIDAGPNKTNTTTIKAYLDKYCTDGTLEYVIATHSDEDHISGFVGSSSGGVRNGIFYSYPIETLIQFDRHNKKSNGEDTQLYLDYAEAVEYLEEQGTQVYTALQCWNNADGAQRTYYLDEAQTISMNILYNIFYEEDSSDNNNYSVCMLLSQDLEEGAKHYLFTGDLEKEGEEALVEHNDLPQVELYKAGHHGSKTSSNTVLLDVIRPKYVVVCCCAGYNEYGAAAENIFPTQAFIDRIGAYTEKVYVTIMWDEETDGYKEMNGDIVFYYGAGEGETQKSLKLWCSNNTTKLKDTQWFQENRTWSGV